MARKKGIRFIYDAAIFILLEIAALAMLRNSGAMHDLWISKGLHSVTAKVWGSLDDIRYYFSLKAENDKLAQENFILAQELRHCREMFGRDSSGLRAFSDICRRQSPE